MVICTLLAEAVGFISSIEHEDTDFHVQDKVI